MSCFAALSMESIDVLSIDLALSRQNFIGDSAGPPVGSSFFSFIIFPFLLGQRINRIERIKQLIGDLEIMDSAKEENYWRKFREFQWRPDDTSLIKIPLTPKLVPKLDDFLEANNTIRHYSVGANVAWVAWSQQIDHLDQFLKGENLSGLTILGSTDQIRTGAWDPGVFYQRVKEALDPSGKWAEV